MHKLFEYFINYQCYIKISIIFLSINSICINCIFYNIYPLGHYVNISIKNQVIPFLNNISLSKDFWSFSDGLYNTIKTASKFFLTCFCEGAGHKIFQLNTWSIFPLMCSAGSNLWSDYYAQTIGWLYFGHFFHCNYLRNVDILYMS